MRWQTQRDTALSWRGAPGEKRRRRYRSASALQMLAQTKRTISFLVSVLSVCSCSIPTAPATLNPVGFGVISLEYE